jgi:hypothetical protein
MTKYHFSTYNLEKMIVEQLLTQLCLRDILFFSSKNDETTMGKIAGHFLEK